MVEPGEPLSPLDADLPQRVLLITREGPLLLDLVISLDGQPMAETCSTLSDQVLQLADEDRDGEVTWDEATTSPHMAAGQYGNAMLESVEQRRQLVYRCDLNRNGRVDRDEIWLWLSPNAKSTRLLEVRSESTSRTGGSGPLFSSLDADGNRFLDAAEVRAAATRLRRYDRNDDGILTPSELPSEMEGSGEAKVGQDAVGLHSDVDWSGTLFLLEDRYAYGSPLTADDLAGRPQLFAAVDLDQDGSWSPEEAEQLGQLPADLELSVAFGREGGLAAQVSAAAVDRDRVTWSMVSPDELRLALGDSEIRVRRRTSPLPEWEQASWTDRWSAWDGDQNGELSAAEYEPVRPVFAIPFDSADLDHSGGLNLDEAREVLRRRTAASRCRVLVELSVERRPVWALLDTDDDGLLEERELDTAADRLEALRTVASELRAEVFPVPLRLELRRASPESETAEDRAVESRQPSNADVPAWFRGMDLNRDGDISRREFPGSNAVFQQLDRNGDGFLERSEVPEEKQASEGRPTE